MTRAHAVCISRPRGKLNRPCVLAPESTTMPMGLGEGGGPCKGVEPDDGWSVKSEGFSVGGKFLSKAVVLKVDAFEIAREVIDTGVDSLGTTPE